MVKITFELMWRTVGILTWILLLSKCSIVQSYGQMGHYVIGEVTGMILDDRIKDKISECGFLEDFDGSMGKASLWADAIKRNPRYRWTSPFHYYDIDNDPPAYCGRMVQPANNRSVNLYNGLRRAIANITHITHNNVTCGSSFYSKMLLHLVQDMFQPLHLTGKDRGGNDKWFEHAGKRYNLHTFWDTDVLNFHVMDIFGSDYTLHDAVSYFYNRTHETGNEKHACIDKEAEGTNKVSLTMQYIERRGQKVLENNCRLVWNVDDLDYFDRSKREVAILVTESINALKCILETVYY